jgi:hypothetical protein
LKTECCFERISLQWPKLMAYAIGIIQNADSLTLGQKRDILYNNAARFLWLDSKSPKGSDRISGVLQLTLAEGVGWAPHRLPPQPTWITTCQTSAELPVLRTVGMTAYDGHSK